MADPISGGIGKASQQMMQELQKQAQELQKSQGADKGQFAQVLDLGDPEQLAVAIPDDDGGRYPLAIGIARELRAHLEWLRPWVGAGRAPELLHGDEAAKIAKQSAKEGRSVRDVVREKGLLKGSELDRVLNRMASVGRNAAFADRTGRYLAVSTLIQGAVGVFDLEKGRYDEVTRGFVGCQQVDHGLGVGGIEVRSGGSRRGARVGGFSHTCRLQVD